MRVDLEAGDHLAVKDTAAAAAAAAAVEGIVAGRMAAVGRKVAAGRRGVAGHMVVAGRKVAAGRMAVAGHTAAAAAVAAVAAGDRRRERRRQQLEGLFFHVVVSRANGIEGVETVSRRSMRVPLSFFLSSSSRNSLTIFLKNDMFAGEGFRRQDLQLSLGQESVEERSKRNRGNG